MTVLVRDAGGLSDTIRVTIRLLEITAIDNTDPGFGDLSYEFDVRENAPAGLIGRVKATDAERDTLTYSIIRVTGGVDADNLFRIDQTGRLYTTEPLDHETATGGAMTYTVSVSVTDGRTDGTPIVTITVENVNEPPVFGTLAVPITAAVLMVDETPVRGSFTSVDVDAPIPTEDPERAGNIIYSLTGTDAASFSIDATTDFSRAPSRAIENQSKTGP